MHRCIAVCVALLSVVVTQNAVAAVTDSVMAPSFSLITVGQGGEVYLLEGHTALRVVTPDGRDRVVNWGMFDFDDPGFGMKFAKGETDYWVAECPTPYFLCDYERTGRSITEQSLNLTDEEAETLLELVETNLLPENRVYRYRYLTDNCATRPLSLIEKAISENGGVIETNIGEERVTWRDELRNYHYKHPLYQLFIDIALGSGIDREITRRERAFAPIYLCSYIESAKVREADGTVRPLAYRKNVLREGVAGVAGSEPSPWIVVLPLALCALAVAYWQYRRRRLVKWFYAAIFTIYGVLGVMVAFLMFVSTQEATGSNLNIMWLNPLCLIVPLLIWCKRTRRVLGVWMWLNAVAVLLFVILRPVVTQSAGSVVTALALIDLILSVSYLAAEYPTAVKAAKKIFCK